MWRSFLTRSQPLLSHLRRPSGCSAAAGDSLVAAALGGAHPRPYTSGTGEADAGKSLPRPGRHLYVVLDEMQTGRSIYMLDVDDLDGGDEDAVTGMDCPGRAPQQTPPMPCRLPEPVLRLGYSFVGSWANFAAVGSKIVVTGNTRREHRDQITLVYDIKTARLDMEQPPPAGFMHYGFHAVAVRNKLYRFDSGSGPPHYLCEQQTVEFDGGYESYEDDRKMLETRGQIMEWTWKNAPSLPANIHSCAVHPDGRTIFVSCGADPVTFSLDTEHGGQWTRRGDWSLPFHGRAYYDGHLEAWVGIQKAKDDNDGWFSEKPYLYSCDVPNLADDDADHLPKPLATPEWRKCKEELTFRKNASGHALVHTGRGRFCLVEATPMVPLEERRTDASPSQCERCTMYHGNEHLLHVTMFSVKHGKDGELVFAPCRSGRSYLVPHYADDAAENPPIAFWM